MRGWRARPSKCERRVSPLRPRRASAQASRLLSPAVSRLVERGDNLGKAAQGLLAGDGKSIGAAFDAVKPAINVALHHRSGQSNTRYGAQFGEPQGPRCKRTDAAEGILAVSGNDRHSMTPANIEVGPAPLELAEQQCRLAFRLARPIRNRLLDHLHGATRTDQHQPQTDAPAQF